LTIVSISVPTGDLEPPTPGKRVSFDRPHPLDINQYSSPPSYPSSYTDEVRALINEHSESTSLKLCRLITITSASGAFDPYQAACRNKFSCATCSPYLLELAQAHIAEVLSPSEGALFLTLTLADEQDHHLGIRLRNLLQCWEKSFNTGSWMTDFKTKNGITGLARSMEITFPMPGNKSQNFGHPHLHVAVALDQKPSQETADALLSHWVSTAQHQGFRASIHGQRGRVVAGPDDRDTIAFYLTEQHALRASRKEHSRYPGDLLSSVLATGDADDLTMLRTFWNVTKGKHKVSYSGVFRPVTAVQ